MNELIKKVLASDENALNSPDAFVSAASKLGYSQEEIDAALDLLEDFPLDDDQLEEIAGGFVSVKPFTPNISMPKNPTSSSFI